jgi:hypothetical protein
MMVSDCTENEQGKLDTALIKPIVINARIYYYDWQYDPYTLVEKVEVEELKK